MKRKALISIVLALILLVTALSSLTSCGDTGKSEVTTKKATTDDTVSEDDTLYPPIDYDKATFRVYYRTQESNHYKGLYICPFEDSADVLDDVAETRNMRVEERYNITFEPIRVSDPTDTLTQDLASGQSAYDVMLADRGSLGGHVLSNHLYDLNYLNIDYTKPWWDANCAEQYSVAGKLFIMVNDVSINNLCNTRFYYFNKAVLSDFNLKSPYDYVEENKWTIDTLFTMMKDAHAPSADGGVGVYAFLAESDATEYYMLTGVGVPTLEKDADGNTVCRLGEYSERAATFFDKYNVIANNSEITLTYSAADALDPAGAALYGDRFVHARTMFAEGHFLFCHSDLDAASREFIGMVKGFGIVPNPKFDSDQERYYHNVDTNALAWAVPNFADLDFEMIENVFDYWAYVSHSTLMESFYESCIKAKRASDPTTAGMVDIIKGSTVYYISDIYTVGGIDKIINNNGTSFATGWASNKVLIEKSLAALNDKIAKLN